MDHGQGSQVRRVRVEPVPGLAVTVLVPADEDAVLDTAVRDPSVDPYAHTLWPAGLAAAAALADCMQRSGEHGARNDLHVLDVGAGCGIVTLTAAGLGARVCALDHDAAALERLQSAAALQHIDVQTQCFDIHSPEDLPRADIAVFSDLLYDTDLARTAALRVIEAHEAGAHVIVADPGRTGRAGFLAMLTARGIDVAFNDMIVRLPGDTAVAVGVLEIPT